MDEASSKAAGKPPALKRQGSSVGAVDAAGASGSVYEADGCRWAASLALVDMSTNTDKFYKVELLEDDGEYSIVAWWGRTGTKGQTKLDSAVDLDAAKAAFAKKFREKSGAAWEDRETYVAAANKYKWKNVTQRPNKGHVLWQYWVDDGVDGKRDGWYDYMQVGVVCVGVAVRRFGVVRAELS